jgi:hypothetical protein
MEFRIGMERAGNNPLPCIYTSIDVGKMGHGTMNTLGNKFTFIGGMTGQNKQIK